MATLTDMMSKLISANTASSSGSETLPVAPVSAPMPNLKPFIPYPSRRDNEKCREQANEQIKKFYEIFKEMSFKISFTDALILMPKFTSTLKAFIGNKEKLSEMARTTMNKHCSAVILNKLPRKLGDPGKFLIPCEFSGMDECLALTDLSDSINLMLLSVWEGFHSQNLLQHGADAFLGLEDDPDSLKINPFYYDPEGDILLLEAILNSKPSPPLPNQEQNMPLYKEELKAYEAQTVKSSVDEPSEVELKDPPHHFEYAFLEGDNKLPVIIAKELGTTRKDHFPLLFMDQMLERLAGNEYYCFLDGVSGCMLAIFHDMVEKTIEVFMDDFSVFRNSFENCLSRLDKMLQLIEFDKAKIDVIAKLPHPTTVKGIRSFLGHASFYRRFIHDFSKISRPMTHLLKKNTPFMFSEDCIQAFQTLKKKLTEAPILIAPNWDLPFELMCDASDFAICAVLGQRHEKHIKPIHYASKTMNDAKTNYTTTEKEMVAVVYAFE
nr:reverse transcriptase domain-containing protein [Tanacetum cinerariifolium]